tara:strand:- start:182 stop:1258 length:1077 start_codon:yes stop_codon:yes gene_type:complete
MYSRHDPNMLATSYDASRYVGLKNFFEGSVFGQKSAWHLFFTYTLFIAILEKLNLINYYVEVQYIIYYLSSILFYKSLINFNFSKLTSFLSTLFIISNPFFIFWIHTLNHAGLTTSLLMISFFFLSKYDHGKLFKILFFISIFFSLKVDPKVFFPIFMILFYKFYLMNEKKITLNILALAIFFILYFLYLNKYAIGLQPFSVSYLQKDIASNKFISPAIDGMVMETYKNCLITEFNSLRNHFCALVDHPLYSIKLYSARLFMLLTWVNTKLSFKYNFFAASMMFFIYFGLIINLLKTKFTKFKFFLISAFLITNIVVLPYVLRGDQKFVFYGLIFIIPLSFSGFELFLKYLKKSKLPL